MTPKRFMPSVATGGMGPYGVMVSTEKGDWVHYADYLNMENRVGLLEEKVDILNGDLIDLHGRRA